MAQRFAASIRQRMAQIRSLRSPIGSNAWAKRRVFRSLLRCRRPRCSSAGRCPIRCGVAQEEAAAGASPARVHGKWHRCRRPRPQSHPPRPRAQRPGLPAVSWHSTSPTSRTTEGRHRQRSEQPPLLLQLLPPGRRFRWRPHSPPRRLRRNLGECRRCPTTTSSIPAAQSRPQRQQGRATLLPGSRRQGLADLQQTRGRPGLPPMPRQPTLGGALVRA